MKKRLFLNLLTAIFLLSGCATSKLPANGNAATTHAESSQPAETAAPATSQHTSPSMTRLAAVDLVNALMQLDEYHPTGKPLHIQHADNEFNRELNAVLETAGFRLEPTHTDAARLVKTSDKTNPDNAAIRSFKVSIENLQLKRDYETQDGRVKPASYLYVKGASTGQLKLNDQIFDSPSYAVDNKQLQADALVSTEKQPEVKIVSASSTNTEKQELKQQNQTPPIQESIAMQINGQREPGPVTRGENLVLTIHSVKDANLHCYYRDADNTVMRVYPNRFSKNPRIDAGKLLKIPSVDDWSIKAPDTAATEEFMCIASETSQQHLTDFLQQSSDFEPMPVGSFDQLLAELNQANGSQPNSMRINIQTN